MIKMRDGCRLRQLKLLSLVHAGEHALGSTSGGSEEGGHVGGEAGRGGGGLYGSPSPFFVQYIITATLPICPAAATATQKFFPGFSASRFACGCALSLRRPDGLRAPSLGELRELSRGGGDCWENCVCEGWS